MKQYVMYVWSSGCQEWQETKLHAITNLYLFTFSHTKKFGKGKLHIYKDDLFRYFGVFSCL